MNRAERKRRRSAMESEEAPVRKGVKLGRIVPGPGHSPRMTDDKVWRTLVPPSIAVRERASRNGSGE